MIFVLLLGSVMTLLSPVYGDSDGNLIVGHYVLKSKPDAAMWDLLKEIGVSQAKIDGLQKGQVEVTLSKFGAKYQFELISDDFAYEWNAQPGKEVEETFINGQKCKLLIYVKDGNRLDAIRTCPDFKITCTATFSERGVDVSIEAKGKSAQMRMERTKWEALTRTEYRVSKS